MALTEADKRTIREDMLKPLTQRVDRVDVKVEQNVAEVSEIRQDQATISANMNQFVQALELEREERRRCADHDDSVHKDLYDKHSKLSERVGTINTAAQVGDASMKGLAIGLGKAVAFIVSLGAAVVAALAFASSQGWLGPAGG